MIKIKIISVGKIKEKAMNEIIGEFEKRLTRYCSFESIILPDSPVKDTPSASDIDAVLKKEAGLISAKKDPKFFTITLCIEGKKINSEKLSSLIAEKSISYPGINFIIGSSHGLHEDIKKESDFKMSMSDMTFPHNIARLMLTEQIYRAFKISSNEAYHK